MSAAKCFYPHRFLKPRLGLLSADESIDEDYALEIAARFAKHYDCQATQLLPDDRFDEALGLNCPTAFGLDCNDEHDLFLGIDLPEMLGEEGTKMFEAHDSSSNTLSELIIEIQRIKQCIARWKPRDCPPRALGYE